MFFTHTLVCLTLVSAVQVEAPCPGPGPCPPPPPTTSTSGSGVIIGGCSQLHKSSDKTLQDPETATCYYFYNVNVGYSEAVARCENEGTKVVELGTRAEQDWLIGNLLRTGAFPRGTTPSVWLGLFRQRSGVWNWVYKTRKWPVGSPRWISTSPSSSPNYTMAVTDRNGQWRAVTRVGTGQVVCEGLRPENLPRQTPPPPVTMSSKKTLPSSCPKVGREKDNMAISEYKRLSIKVLVTELSVSEAKRGTRIACAKRCSQKSRCAMFVKQSSGKCYLYQVSDSGVLSACDGNPPVCYWKTCWIPELDVIP